MALLDIIIVNWNAGILLRKCLDSITLTSREGYELSRVVVVDNASSDKSVTDLEDLALPLSILHNKRNLGFGAACNQGAKGSKADYLLFLNPDTRLFNKSLSEPINFMNKSYNQHVAVCGIQLKDDSGSIARSCVRFPQPGTFLNKILGLDKLDLGFLKTYKMHDWDHAESREVDHVIGAFYLVRRSVFNRLQGFDEQFFLYLEDLDFSYRVTQIGMSSFYLAEAQAYHKGGGTSEQVMAKRLYYSLQSRILYGFKHFSTKSALGLMFGTLLLEPLLRVVNALFKGSISMVKETMHGYAMLWVQLPMLIMDRIKIKK